MAISKHFSEKAAKFTRSIPLWLATLGGTAAFTGMTTPSVPDTRLSDKAPVYSTVQAGKDYKALATEGERLAREFDSVSFLETSLSKAQENLGRDNKDGKEVAEQIDALQQQHSKLQDRVKKRDDDIATFHDRLSTTFTLSEKEASDIYFNALKGKMYESFYTQDFAYRDECRLTVNMSGSVSAQRNRINDCAEAMNKDEGRHLWNWSTAARNEGIAGGLLLGAAGFAGAWNRRRTAKEKRKPFDDLNDLKKMLKPRL